MLESHKDAEIAASPLAAAEKDLNAIQLQLTSLGNSCWHEIRPLLLWLRCFLVNFAHNAAAVCSCDLKCWHAILLSYTFHDRLGGNYTSSYTIDDSYSNRVSRHRFFKGRIRETESSLSLMFVNIIHEEIVSSVAVWRSAVAQRKQTFLVVNNGKQTGVDNGNEATSVKWAAPGRAGHGVFM